MFRNCIDRFGRKKNNKKTNKQTNKQTKKNQINGNNSTYHEPLSEECIERRF